MGEWRIVDTNCIKANYSPWSSINRQFVCMVFLLGKTLPSPQHVLYALAAQFDGVGRHTAARICAEASIHRFCKVRDLNERHLAKLRASLLPHLERMQAAKIEKAKAERVKPKPVPMPPVVLASAKK